MTKPDAIERALLARLSPDERQEYADSLALMERHLDGDASVTPRQARSALRRLNRLLAKMSRPDRGAASRMLADQLDASARE